MVIAIIAILAAMLLPALSSAKARGKRIACVNNTRQFLLAIHLYANDNGQRLPSGASDSNTPDGVTDDAVPILSGLMYTQMVQYAGNYKVLGCPNLSPPFNTSAGLVPGKLRVCPGLQLPWGPRQHSLVCAGQR